MQDYLKAGKIHKAVQVHTRNYLNSFSSECVPLADLTQCIEEKIKDLTGLEGLKGGVAFPTGVNLNHCAAHYTNFTVNDKTVLSRNDIIKIDYGVHINGHIVDGAFSFSFSDSFDDLIKVSEEATDTGIAISGVDADVYEIGVAIQEVIESYEPVDEKFKSIGDLCGHEIQRYHIHGGKPVPNVKFPAIKGRFRMKENEVYAIETFPSTGSGNVTERISETTHYMLKRSQKGPDSLTRSYGTLAFCPRWLNEEQLRDFHKNKHLYQGYPPLYDVAGSHVAQTEHTIYITDNGKIVLN